MYKGNLLCAIQNVLCRHNVYRCFNKKSDYEKQRSMSNHLSSFAKNITKSPVLSKKKKKNDFGSMLRFMPLQDREFFEVFCHLKRK